MTLSNATYTELIIHEHEDKPKFVASVLASVDPIISTVNALYANVTAIDLDVAAAPGLDIVGSWLARQRESLPNAPVSDNLYQMVLRSKIISNQWNGSIEQMYDTWNLVYPDREIIIQEVGTLDIMIGLLGAAQNLAFSTIATPLCETPINYGVINHVVLTSFFMVGGTPTPTLLFNSSSEPYPVAKTLVGAAADTRNLHIYVVFEPANPDIFYNILSPEPWATISPTIPSVLLVEYANDVFVRSGSTYTLAMPDGWAVADDWTSKSIVWERPPAIEFDVSGWERVASDEIYMLKDGHIVPKPSGVRIVEYLVLSTDGKMFAWDIENSYFAGWDDGLWAMEFAPGSTGEIFPWILATGLWDDMGEWDDYDTWEDSP